MNKREAMRHAHMIIAQIAEAAVESGRPLKCPTCDNESDDCGDCNRISAALEAIIDRHYDAAGDET